MPPFFDHINKSTPLTDKILAALGLVTTGTLTMGHLQAGVGILVGGLTALVLIPRVVLAWRDMLRKLGSVDESEPEDDGEGD